MFTSNLLDTYSGHLLVPQIIKQLKPQSNIRLSGLSCSSSAFLSSAVIQRHGGNHIFVLPDDESAAHFQNDLSNIVGDEQVYYFPSSYKRITAQLQPHESNIVLRTRTLQALIEADSNIIIVTHAHALAEKTISGENLNRNTLQLQRGEKISIDFIRDVLYEYGFTACDFVYQPGQFSVRGGIVDIFSYSHNKPYRIDFLGDIVDSIRIFDVDTQLSENKIENIRIIPNISVGNQRSCFLKRFGDATSIWTVDLVRIIDEISNIAKISELYMLVDEEYIQIDNNEVFVDEKEILAQIKRFCNIEFGQYYHFETDNIFKFNTLPQPKFNKNFELLAKNINTYCDDGYTVSLLSENKKQFDRLQNIFSGIKAKVDFKTILNIVHEGFIDHDLKICYYTDHQIFDRYRKYRTAFGLQRSQNMTIKDLNGLHPGDYIVHIDHGVGVFGGLEKQEINGKVQEYIRLVYSNNDLLYVNIHSLHKISKFRGKDSEQPKLNKLGSSAWNTLKQNTKRKVKDIARDLILLYVQRRENKGFAFSADTYLQEELEASFIYEDTPDQLKATNAVKSGMESDIPMDHLVCGDVGFGKTEVAIRAAFKAATDGKQVALLVPTTILALQHEQTFKERLEKFPCKVASVSRLKSTAVQREIFKELEEGKIDIIIGTHKLLGKDVKFKDLGLLIIDEEQKFGVAAKEKLKSLRVNIDTLTLTATPIPRTLQFSLMGVRQMSIIATPPPNRHPIQTELSVFNKDTIRQAIEYEVARGGQVFFIHNRIQSLHQIEKQINDLCPKISTVAAHGRLDGEDLEQIMLDFINGDFNVLISTSIIESGLDIPNANTIIINNAQSFGLSDLHQLRGRVGRSNKKAFCYLMTPPATDLTPEARRRLKAIEEFSELGSGFNIAMQDLDIRGAGNMIGAEQSGFIAAVGFEIYHSILNEAMMELRDELSENQLQLPAMDNNLLKTSNCQIDTDMQLLFPESYIENVSERVRLYRDLDNTTTEEQLQRFEQELIDRFGALPKPSAELINVVRLRWKAAALGFVKMAIRGDRLVAYFMSDAKSLYYQSDTFTKILTYIQKNPKQFKMKESNDKLALLVTPVKDIGECIELFDRLLG